MRAGGVRVRAWGIRVAREQERHHAHLCPLRSLLPFQAFSRCQLKHTIALWQLLSAHRSEQLLRLHKVSAAPPLLDWGRPTSSQPPAASVLVCSRSPSGISVPSTKWVSAQKT